MRVHAVLELYLSRFVDGSSLPHASAADFIIWAGTCCFKHTGEGPADCVAGPGRSLSTGRSRNDTRIGAEHRQPGSRGRCNCCQCGQCGSNFYTGHPCYRGFFSYVSLDLLTVHAPETLALSLAPLRVAWFCSGDLRAFRYNQVRKVFLEAPQAQSSSLHGSFDYVLVLKVARVQCQSRKKKTGFTFFMCMGVCATTPGSSSNKRDMWVRRYEILKQRLLRNPMFAPPAANFRLPAQQNKHTFELTALESLIGTVSSAPRCVMGMCPPPSKYHTRTRTRTRPCPRGLVMTLRCILIPTMYRH